VYQHNLTFTREELASAELRLAHEQSGARANQNAIAEARSEVERLRLQLASDQDKVDRASVRAMVPGVVTTTEFRLSVGKWTKLGDTLLEVDNTNVLHAEIEIPEDDIDLVKAGAKVLLRPWANQDSQIVGRVASIGSSALAQARLSRNELAMAEGAAGNPRDRNQEGTPAGRDEADEIETEPSDQAGQDGPSVAIRAAGVTDNMPSFDRVQVGSVRRRAESAGSADQVGRVTRVKASFQNPPQFLRPGMTGYAKISGVDTSLGEAYLRGFSRLIKVGLWSWVP
jgi:hypothetical protein